MFTAPGAPRGGQFAQQVETVRWDGAADVAVPIAALVFDFCVDAQSWAEPGADGSRPRGLPLALWVQALVASSLIKSTASSLPGAPARKRARNARTARTCSGRPAKD